MEKIINIYSPCDGEIKPISELKDGVFSEKMLGDGFYIKPTSTTFYSPFDNGWLENVFETKHAYHFKHPEGPILLMHIGLDTVSLKGEGFKILQKTKSKISQKTKIVEVDINAIQSKNLSVDTPLVFEINNQDYILKNIKTGLVKQGEVVAKLELNVNKEASDILSNLEFKTKFEKVAEDIYKIVGTDINVKKAYNCMTRFRLLVKDKTLVDQSKLKEIPLVKGINWNGDELQIIIGGDAYKVREAYQNFVEGLNKKSSDKLVIKNVSIKQKIMGFISGIIIPVLPIMITAGLLKALQAILEQTGAIQKVSISMKLGEISKLITDYDLISGVIFTISNVGLAFLGVAFIVSTVKYFKGNIYIGLFIGLTLMNPYLTGGLNWVLFRIGAVDIKIQSYGSSIIPMVTAGVIYIYLDRWIKLWMPATVDIIFRPFLAYIFTVLPILFILGPILGIVESGIYYLMTTIGKIPYGIGAGLFSFAWQFLVITGVHTAINGFINMSIANNQPTVLGICFTITVFSQMGAGIGMLIRTKNSNSKKAILAAIPATWFGISEPILYGSTLPKFRPFLMGCVGAGIGGLFCGITGLTSYTVSAGGIFAILRVIEGGWVDIGLYVLAWIITIAASILLTAAFYKERPDELKETKKLNKNLVYIYTNWKNDKTVNLNEKLSSEMQELLNLLNKENLNLIKKFDHLLEKGQKIDVYIKTEEEKIETRKSSLILKAKKYQGKSNIAKIEKLNEKFKNLDNLSKLDKYKEKLDIILEEQNDVKNEIEKLQDQYLKVSEGILKEMSKELNHPFLIEYQTLYFNAIHSCDINYMITEKQDLNRTLKSFKSNN